jgi:hypothetical protein
MFNLKRNNLLGNTSAMKQNINKNSSELEEFTGTNLADSIQEKSLPPNNIARKNKELQQEQTRYLNRMLEAYGDCV